MATVVGNVADIEVDTSDDDGPNQSVVDNVGKLTAPVAEVVHDVHNESGPKSPHTPHPSSTGESDNAAPGGSASATPREISSELRQRPICHVTYSRPISPPSLCSFKEKNISKD